jgi:hypothetical protein
MRESVRFVWFIWSAWSLQPATSPRSTETHLSFAVTPWYSSRLNIDFQFGMKQEGAEARRLCRIVFFTELSALLPAGSW